MIHGIDVSHYQGKIDFHAVKDNADFVIIKSTYGNGYKDSNFETNRDGARGVDLAVGFYHYCYPSLNQPQDEATWFTKTVVCQPGEILVLDFEESYPDPVGWSKAFLDKCTSNMGFKPLIYLNQSLVKSYDWTSVIKAGYGLWLAQYDYNIDGNPVATPWPFVAMRQYSDKGSVAGMNPVDLDVFYGDLTAFKKYGNPAPPPPSAPPAPTITDQTVIPQIVDPNGKPMQVQAIRSTMAAQEQQITNLLTKIDALNVQIANIPASTASVTLQTIHDIIYGQGFWWTKWSKIKALLPK